MPVNHSPVKDRVEEGSASQAPRRSARIKKGIKGTRLLNAENREDIIANESADLQASDTSYRPDGADSQSGSQSAAESVVSNKPRRKRRSRSHAPRKNPRSCITTAELEGSQISSPRSAVNGSHGSDFYDRRSGSVRPRDFSTHASRSDPSHVNVERIVSACRPAAPFVPTEPQSEMITLSQDSLRSIIEAAVAKASATNSHSNHSLISRSYWGADQTEVAACKPGHETLAITDDLHVLVAKIFDPIIRRAEELKKMKGRNNRLLQLVRDHLGIPPTYHDPRFEALRLRILNESDCKSITLSVDEVLMLKGGIGVLMDCFSSLLEVGSVIENDSTRAPAQKRPPCQCLQEIVVDGMVACQSLCMPFLDEKLDSKQAQADVGAFISCFARLGSRANLSSLSMDHVVVAGDAPLPKFTSHTQSNSRPWRNQSFNKNGKHGNGKNKYFSSGNKQDSANS